MHDKYDISKIIALDFDGVIHSYVRGWTGEDAEDPPNPGTEEALQQLIDEGFILKIYSARPSKNIKEYLKRWDLEKYIHEVCEDKPPAIAYIDDHGVRFRNWNQALKDVKKFS